jgi:NAD dependent epimerase/dehydratase
MCAAVAGAPRGAIGLTAVTGSLSDKRVLVTGAGGFIGSHTAELLLREGASVRPFVRYTAARSPGSLAHAPNLADFDVRYGDLRDPETVDQVISGCDIVLHLGAQVSVPFSYASPRDVVETNVMGTLNVLSAARRLGIERVVLMSTSEVYGTPESVPITERHLLNAQSPYAASKIAADMLASSFHRSFGVPVGTLRAFNTYGPRQSTRAIIPTIVTQALEGAVVRLGALEPVRDFTYVSDTVAGLLAFAAWSNAPGRTVQVGSGVGVTVLELVTMVSDILGRPLDVVVDPERLRPAASEVHRLVSDARVARETLGWEPAVSLREGLGRTIAWTRQHAGVTSGARYSI